MDVERHLSAATGFFELGMHQDAWDELEAVKPEERSLPGVLRLRLAILAELGKWESAAALAEGMVQAGCDECSVYLIGADAIRKTRGTADALHFLLRGADVLFADARYLFRLACLLCQVGRLEDARERLQAAFKIDPDLRLPALQHEDLDALW